jgi:hypothetical protein
VAEGQTGHLLQFDVLTFYVSKELLAAAARTDLPTDIFMDALPFPFPASVFMLPKATIRHPTEGECPYIVVSRVRKGQIFPLPRSRILPTTPENAIVVSTYLPDEFRCYRKTISVVGGETMKSAFERASEVSFEIPGSHLSNPEHTTTTTDADFMDRLLAARNNFGSDNAFRRKVARTWCTAENRQTKEPG